MDHIIGKRSANTAARITTRFFNCKMSNCKMLNLKAKCKFKTVTGGTKTTLLSSVDSIRIT